MWPFSSRQPRAAKHTSRRLGSFRPRLEVLEGRVLLSTFTVVNTGDSGPGSLRQAILQVNQDAQPAADAIAFAIGSGRQTIAPLSALPTITHPVVIDGTTQPGFAGAPLIELDGAGAGATANGLALTGGDSVVQGLVINRYKKDGILLAGNGNVVQGDYLGTDVTGMVKLYNLNGVEVTGSANTIGGTTASARNLISGSDGGSYASGVLLEGNDNVVEGNFIGTNVTGAGALVEGPVLSSAWANYNGVEDFLGTGNLIGGTAPGAGNVISANYNGIYLWESTGSLVEGNSIGLDVTGSHAVYWAYTGYTQVHGNDYGVVIRGGVTPTAPRGGDDVIGGTTPGARNLISANWVDGIEIMDGSSGNLIEGNYIGTDVTGTVALGGRQHGIVIDAGNDGVPGLNTVGGTTQGAGNLISGNSWGIFVAGLFGRPDDNTIQGNDIGTDVTGTKALGNFGYGIYVSGSSSNIIGGAAPGAGNIIAFNSLDGVCVYEGTGNAILENSIFANGGLGIDLDATGKGNNLQAAPVLTSAVSANGALAVAGTLTATANTTYRLEFFSNPSGTRQGQTFLGFITVTTNSKGKASFSANFALTVPLGDSLTATATDPGGDTSEFSNGLAVK